MNILFPQNPLNKKEVDINYYDEYHAALRNNFQIYSFSFEELIYGSARDATKHIKKLDKPTSVIYRGWMLKVEDYKRLYQILADKNLILINSPEEYEFCHYFPQSYKLIKTMTPKSIWFSLEQINDETLRVIPNIFKDKPVIIKDYVKSRKHDWKTACFVPNASDMNQLKTTIQNLIKWQGEEFNKGIVIREFVELDFLEHHDKSKMPLSKEFRVLFFNHEPITILQYWDSNKYGTIMPDISQFIEVAKQIKSNFFTMDIAQAKDKKWIIIELGDGQVSGFPDNANLDEIYFYLK